MSHTIQIIVAEPNPEYQRLIGNELNSIAQRIEAYLCKSGAEAYDTAQSLERLRILITETVMPDIDGINLLVNLRKIRPELKAVILSEYDLSDYSAYLSEAIVLPKPFSSGQLLQALLQLLPELNAYYNVTQPSYQSTPPNYRPPATYPTETPTGLGLPATQIIDSSRTGAQQTLAERSAQFSPQNEPVSALKTQTSQTQPLFNPQPGLKVGAYLLVQKLPDSDWGPCFLASQAGVNRPTKMIFYQDLGYFSVQQFKDYFTRLASAPHPGLLTIIELGEYNGQSYVVEEFWQGRSLAELIASHIQLDARQAAHIGEQVVGALAQISHLPNRQIKPGDLIISDSGVLKISHLYPLPGTPPAGYSDQLSALGNILRSCLSESAKQEPRLARLLDAMITGSISYEQAYTAFHNLQIELAPANLSKESQEAREITAQLEKYQHTKKFGMIIILLSMISLTIFVLAFLYRDKIIQTISPVGVDFSSDMQRIPAGEAQMVMQDPDNPEKTITVPINTKEFWIDTYETTIYEYSLFLAAIKKGKVTPAEIMHPDTPERQRDFVPDDWANILKSALSNSYYRDIKLSPNSPIFNVSFYDAYAYAKWKGKRLPTAEEWLKAARGTQGYPYPWGDAPDDSAANTGLDYMAGRPEEGGKIDGFHGPAPVNDPRMDKDKSPFGVRLMFGNLSEWTSTPGGVALGQQRLRIMGNSYTSIKPNPLSHRSASPIIPSTRNALTGFRLVSDSPPQKKSD